MKKLIIFVLTLFLLVGYYLLFTTKTHAQQVNYVDFIANIDAINVVDNQSSLIVSGSDALNTWILYNTNENTPNQMIISEDWYKYLENIIGSSVRITDKTEIYFKNYLLTNDYTIVFNFNDPSQVGPYPDLYMYINYEGGTTSTIQTSVSQTNSIALDYSYFNNNSLLNKRIVSIAFTSSYFTSIQLFSPQNPYNYDIGYENGKNEILNNPKRFGLYPIEYLQAQYQQGYEDGLSEENSRVYDVGYENGYNDGVYDTQIEGVANVVNFNQLIQNGNFSNSSYWEPTTSTLTTTGEYPTFVATAQYGRITQRNIPLTQNHIYCFLGNLKLTTSGTYIYLQIIRDTNQTIKSSRNTNEWQKLDIIFNYTQSTGNAAFVMGDSRSSGWDNVYITNFMLLDLTQIYGTGNEPNTLQTIYDDFPSSYYPYTTSELVNINYERGYFIGEKDGYQTGYENGKDEQATKQLTSTGWIQNIFSGFQSFFNLQILPGVSIGLIVGIPFVISLAYFVIRAFRGGGGA